MGKDPAFLFYPGDYVGGTMGMSFEEKGAYMDLLMMQFNRGHMTTRMIGQAVGQLWDKVQVKFVQDRDGLWYNERLELEQEKRKSFVSSRNNNLLGKNQYTKQPEKKIGHMEGHTTSHMEDRNEDENEDEKETKKANQKKHKHGQYKHVLLTEDEYQRLSDEWGIEVLLQEIKNMDEGIEMKGYKYKNHNLALRKWNKNGHSKNTETVEEEYQRKYGGLND